MNIEADKVKQERFTWGVLLSWIPSALFFAPASILHRMSIPEIFAPELVSVVHFLSAEFLIFGCVVAIIILVDMFSKVHAIPSSLVPALRLLVIVIAGAYVSVLLSATLKGQARFAIFGCFTIAGLELAGVVLLSRTFAKGHPARGALSALSICSGVLMAGVAVVYAWVLQVSFFFKLDGGF
jgi:hypothetical protein